METFDVSSLSLDAMLSREWLTVNHLGGYAASTLPSCNTRKYHGLLVAAMSPPVRRMVILSRVEETIFQEGWPHALGCNEYPETVHPHGHTLLRAFSNQPFPRWAYQGSGWTLEKQLRMLKGENTVLLSYTLEGAAKPVELEVRPLFALRPIHEIMYQWNGNLAPQELSKGHHQIKATHATPEAFFAHDGRFTGEGYWYLNTIYRRENERGYSGLEDLWSPGVVRFTLAPGQTVHFACSTEPIDLPRIIAAAEKQYAAKRAPVMSGASVDSALETLETAASHYLVQTREGKTMLSSGYPWSAPDGRDAMINVPGLLLVTGKLAVARAVLDHFAGLCERGLMPSEFPTDGSAPRYRGADVSLWFINALWEYLKYSGDESAVGKFHPVVEQIIEHYQRGTGLGIKLDPEGLLVSGGAAIATTWMNAEPINGEGAITPRLGRAVEVNALWHNALRIAGELARRLRNPLRGEELYMLANRCRAAFNRRFWNETSGCCYDVVADDYSDGSIRPNQLLAISLAFPVLAPERHAAVLTRVREELLTPLGVRTLTRGDGKYCGRYIGSVSARDRAYHNGSVYPWLLGPFISAMVRVYGRTPAVIEQARAMLAPCLEHLNGQGCGQIHELFDGDAPHHAGGLTASARSIAEVLRVYAEEVQDLGPAAAEQRGQAQETSGEALKAR